MTAATAVAAPQLSERHREVLCFLLAYHEQHGYAPSMREIVESTRCASTSVAQYALVRLAEYGYIRLGAAGQSRAIDVRPALARAAEV